MQIGLGIGIPFTKSQVWLAVQAVFTPAKLFESGANGLWLDPSDLTTLFQDSAGTTPVTAVEQPVGLIRDKSGRNNHASQSTSANRPTLSARYNLLTKTETFSDVVWAAATSIGTVTKGTTTGMLPDGTSGTIDTLTFPVVSAGGWAFLYQNVGQTLLNIQVAQTIYVRISSGTANIFLNMEDMGAAPVGGNFIAGSAETVTTSWRRISLTGTRTSNTGNSAYAIGFDTRAAAGQTNSSPVTIEVWGASVVPANQSSLPYQRVNTATDYDSDATKFPWYLKFNGTSSSMQTASINFTATDKMFVSAGVRKLSDATSGAIVELSTGGSVGSFLINTPSTAGNSDYQAVLYGNGNGIQRATSFASPITNVVSASYNFAGSAVTDEISIRVNSATPTLASSGTPSTTAAFGNYPLYIGARAGTSLFFNGYLYQLVIAGKQASNEEITSTETYTNSKTKAY